jgi:hypothetical protein
MMATAANKDDLMDSSDNESEDGDPGGFQRSILKHRYFQKFQNEKGNWRWRLWGGIQ